MQFERGVGAGQKAGCERCLKGNQMHARPLMNGPPVQALLSEKVDEMVTSCAR